MVRFLTKRYIGEYDHQSETRYKNEVLVDGDPVIFEICDLCPRHLEDLPSIETLAWADGVLLVYSITERGSFNFIKQVWNIFQVGKSIKIRAGMNYKTSRLYIIRILSPFENKIVISRRLKAVKAKTCPWYY